MYEYFLENKMTGNLYYYNFLNRKMGRGLYFQYKIYFVIEKMNLEKLRLRTFCQFPNDYIDIKALAKYGFYYIGENETCKCYFCNIEVTDWNIYSSPLLEHWRQSTNCPLLMKIYTNNVPI